MKRKPSVPSRGRGKRPSALARTPRSGSKPSAADRTSAPAAGPTGGPAHRRWLAEVVGPTPAPQIVCQDDVRAVHEPPARLGRLAPALPEQGNAWRWRPVVDARPARRGGPGPVAVTRVADVGALTRCEPPRARRQCLGRVPSASATGERRQQGAMTQAGHTHARRGLGAGAWASPSPATVSRPVPRRLAKPPTGIPDIRWQAQLRLCQRSRRLASRGKHAHGGTVARARALAGLLWAMAQQVPLRASVRRPQRHGPLTSEGLPTCLGRDAAPGWGHPRRR